MPRSPRMPVRRRAHATRKDPSRARVDRRARLGYRARMPKSGDLVVVLLLALAAATLAAAEDVNPCRADMARLCAGVVPGEGRLRDCIRTHARELSPGCSARLQAAERTAE